MLPYRAVVGLVAMMLTLVVGFAPVYVHAQDGRLPELAPVSSLRHNFVFAFNGSPLQVCQTAWESWNRSHGTCRDLATVPEWGLIENYVREVVRYDGTTYLRDNADTSWTTLPDESYDPNLSLSAGLYRVDFDAALSQLDTVDVNGSPATQYQFWSLDTALNAAAGGQIVYDLFISAENRVLKDQVSVRGTVPGLGDGELANIWVYSDFDAPITVSPPPAEQTQPDPSSP